MTDNGRPIPGRDIPIVKLVPRHQRQVAKKYEERIAASLRAVGLIDPLIVFPQGENYEILDGNLRYRLLLDMGIESVPCLIGHEREGFTGNRMVNRLSPAQEMRMLRKSLEELDEKTIAEALGLAGIRHRLNAWLAKKLAPPLVKAFEAGLLSHRTARELAHVKPERQIEILKLMESCKDYSVTFAKGLVLKTPIAQRAKTNGAKTPWGQAPAKKTDLLKKLREAEEQQNFYASLYRQYTANLVKLVVFTRALLTNARIRAYLSQHHPAVLEIVESIITSTEQ